jgi:hypothetical protein
MIKIIKETFKYKIKLYKKIKLLTSANRGFGQV